MKLVKKNDSFCIIHHSKHVFLGTSDEVLAKNIYANVATQFALQTLLSVPMTATAAASTAESENKSSNISVESVFAEYLRSCELKKVTKFTLAFKKAVLKKILSVGIATFGDFTQSKINAYIESIQNYASDTQRKYVTNLIAFLNNSAKKGYIAQDIISRIDTPKFQSKPRELIIEESDWEKILTTAKSKDKDFYLYLQTLFHTFSRPNEVTELKGSDFNLPERYVDIYQNKTQKMKRVFLESDFASEISELVCEKKNNYLFNQHGKNPESYAKKFKYLCKKLDLNPKYMLYTVRHTSITYLMNKTNDVEFVARQAGNNPSITMKHYINRNNKHCLEILDKKI